MNITLTFGINADFNQRFALIVPTTAFFRQLTEAHAWANTEVLFEGKVQLVAETTEEVFDLLQDALVDSSRIAAQVGIDMTQDFSDELAAKVGELANTENA